LQQVLEDIKNQALLIMQQQALGEGQKYEYLKYPRRADAPDLPLEEFPRLVKGLPPTQELPPEKLGLFAKRIAEYVYSEIGFFQGCSKSCRQVEIPGRHIMTNGLLLLPRSLKYGKMMWNSVAR
jgi:arachidonate 5-lipoxygenase